MQNKRYANVSSTQTQWNANANSVNANRTGTFIITATVHASYTTDHNLSILPVIAIFDCIAISGFVLNTEVWSSDWSVFVHISAVFTIWRVIGLLTSFVLGARSPFVKYALTIRSLAVVVLLPCIHHPFIIHLALPISTVCTPARRAVYLQEK